MRRKTIARIINYILIGYVVIAHSPLFWSYFSLSNPIGLSIFSIDLIMLTGGFLIVLFHKNSNVKVK